MIGKSWALMLTTEAILRGAEMGSNLFHLQIVIEEMARTKPHAWPGVPEIARRMGRDVRTARRLLAEWEEAGYGRRVIEGKANDLVGLILFRRLDPKMPAASPETFEAAVEALKADRRGKHTSDKIVLGSGSNSSETSDNTVLPPRSIPSEPPRSTLSDVISIHPERERREPAVSQSVGATDGRTDVSPSGDGDEDGRGMADLRKILAHLETHHRLPVEFREAIEAEGFADRIGRDWRGAALALVRCGERKRMKRLNVITPSDYLPIMVAQREKPRPETIKWLDEILAGKATDGEPKPKFHVADPKETARNPVYIRRGIRDRIQQLRSEGVVIPGPQIIEEISAESERLGLSGADRARRIQIAHEVNKEEEAHDHPEATTARMYRWATDRRRRLEDSGVQYAEAMAAIIRECDEDSDRKGFDDALKQARRTKVETLMANLGWNPNPNPKRRGVLGERPAKDAG